jgi:hypothetical protein
MASTARDCAHTLYAMKLRITKGRIACAVVLLPVLFLLNVGPLIYCCDHFGLDKRVVVFLYGPVEELILKTPFHDAFEQYLDWWEDA